MIANMGFTDVNVALPTRALTSLDHYTQISLDALWKEYVLKSQEQSRMKTVDSLKHKELKINLMEEGNLSPSPKDLPMPLSIWLV